VTVIDTRTDKVIATVPVGERPRGIRLSPDGESLYLALGDEDHIGAVDTTTLRVTAKIPAGTDPETFDVSPDGKRLYVSNEDANTASVIDLDTRQIIATVPVGVEPEGGYGQSRWPVSLCHRRDLPHRFGDRCARHEGPGHRPGGESATGSRVHP
jgi:YVTN family beta-propeller protein